jgi:hypothetical protein
LCVSGRTCVGAGFVSYSQVMVIRTVWYRDSRPDTESPVAAVKLIEAGWGRSESNGRGASDGL